MTAAPIRVMVVDDHTLFRRGLVALLAADGRFEVVGEAGDAAQALQVLAACRPQVLLLDNHLPGASGVVALPSLLAAVPGLRVLMLTMSEDEHDLAAALKGGACGYLLKTVDADELGASIERAGRRIESGPIGDRHRVIEHSSERLPEHLPPLVEGPCGDLDGRLDEPMGGSPLDHHHR